MTQERAEHFYVEPYETDVGPFGIADLICLHVLVLLSDSTVLFTRPL